MPIDRSPDSLAAATRAATFPVVFDETLLRRFTRWFAMRDPDDTEVE